MVTARTEATRRDRAAGEQRPAGPAEVPPQPGWRHPYARVTHAHRHTLSPRQQSAFATWTAFTVTFAAVRGITYAIRHPSRGFTTSSLRHCGSPGTRRQPLAQQQRAEATHRDCAARQPHRREVGGVPKQPGTDDAKSQPT